MKKELIIAQGSTHLRRSDLQQQLKSEGLVLVRQALDSGWIDLLTLGLERNFAHPGPQCAKHEINETTGKPYFASHHSDWGTIPEYQRFFGDSPVADICADLMGCEEIFLYFDNAFLKNGPAGRTPWHQDTPNYIVDGSDLVNVWIPVDPVSKEESLEFIRGSHLGPRYDPRTTPGIEAYLTDQADMLDNIGSYQGYDTPWPDFEAMRDEIEILSWAMEPGDIIVFNPAMVHGGAPLFKEGSLRRSMAARLFGSDACFQPKGGIEFPRFAGIEHLLKPGDLLRHPYFPRLRPRAPLEKRIPTF